jgi:hypothetical protein
MPGCTRVESKVLLIQPEVVLAVLRFQPYGTIHEHAVEFEATSFAWRGEGYTASPGVGLPPRRPDPLGGIVRAQALGAVVEEVFATRVTHELPTQLPPPPTKWARPYRTLATEVGVNPDPRHGHGQVARLLDPLLAGISPEHRWDCQALAWRLP